MLDRKTKCTCRAPCTPFTAHPFTLYLSPCTFSPCTFHSVIVEVGDNEFNFKTPEPEDTEIKRIVEKVWNRYLEVDDFELIRLLHRKGTPWALCYEKGKNNSVPDLYTKTFYKKLIRYINGESD